MHDVAAPAVLYFSKSGHTRRAAEVLAHKTGAEAVPIEVNRYKMPLVWIFRAIWDAVRENTPRLRTDVAALADRPWLVVAGPIWASQPAPPMSSALRALAKTDVRVGLLTTSANPAEPVKCVRTCEAALGRSVAASVNVENKVNGTDCMDQRLSAFAIAMAVRSNAGAA